VAKPQKEDPLVERALDKAVSSEELAAAIAKLDPEAAQYFLTKFEAVFRKRKIQMTGYLVSLVAWAAGMVFALVVSANMDGFTGWLFAIPFALVGLCLYGFGRWAEKIAK
jgi:hypothetical protein